MQNRREFIALAAGGAVLGLLPFAAGMAAKESLQRSRIKAIVFDAFPVFDPRPVFALAESLYPGQGAELSREWRTRQFEYTWLRVAARQYADFWQVTREALEFACARLGVELSGPKRHDLMNAYLELKPWPDVVPALAALRDAGFRLAFLSNFTGAMLEANVRKAGLSGVFEQLLSTDQVRTYKPDPRAYQLGPDSLRLRRQSILFVAFAGWDAAGAKLFGYPTFWANRQRAAEERLGVTPDQAGESLSALVDWLS
jgi:2-haloacid dehalogenase